MELYLNDTPLSQVPIGWQGVTLVRQRNQFRGFSQRNTVVLTENSLLISEPKAVAVIRQAWREKLHNAELQLSVREGSRTLWRSFVDWNIYGETRNGVTLGLSDRQGLRFTEALSRPLAVLPKSLFAWQALPLGGAVTSRIHEERRGVTVGANETHAVPFRGNSQSNGVGEYRDVEALSAHWVNTTGSDLTMQVEMAVTATASSRSSQPYQVFVQLYDAQGGQADRRFVGQFAPGRSTWIFSQPIEVPKGYGLGVLVVSADATCSFEYASSSELSIEERTGQQTQVPVVRLDALLSDWCEQNRFSLRLDWPESRHLYLSCGAWLRGVESRELNLSMEALLTDLNHLFRVQTGQQNGEMYVRLPAEPHGGYWLEKINEVEYPASGLLYGSVTYGYALWRSNTMAGQQEPHHRMTYASPFATREGLDLSATYVSASHKLIESLVRRRSSHLAATTDEESDSQPFLLSDAAGLLTPQAQAERYGADLSYNYPLTLLSKEGDYAEAALNPPQSGRYEPLGCTVDVSLSPDEFDALDEMVSFSDQGRTVTVEIDSVEYALSEGKAIITGNILQHEQV